MILWIHCSGHKQLPTLQQGVFFDTGEICGKKLLKIDIFDSGSLEIRCSKCKTTNEFRWEIK